ncbi:MAG: hypothetical protein ACREQQ_16870, partial [Candidatus Binatia bacterium]
ISRARRMADDRDPEADQARELADLFCRNSRRKVKGLFRDLWRNEDAAKNALAVNVMAGRYEWLEDGKLDVGLTPDAFQTRFLTQAAVDEGAVRAAGGR